MENHGNTKGPTTDDSAGGLEASHKSVHVEIVGVDMENAKQKSGPVKRKRGRPPAEVPSRKNLEILLATRTQTYEEVGESHGLTKQRISQIVQRWKTYLPIAALPSPLSPPTAEVVAPAKRESRPHVISFRLTGAEVRLLSSRWVGIKSPNQVAREILIKFLSI